MPLAATPAACPECASPIEADGVCLACLFREAAVAPLDESEAASRLSSGPRLSQIGRLPLPCEFAGHRLLREIASGGMGVVYEAEDERLKRRVALKMVRSAVLASASEVTRFRAEAEMVAQFDHPHIVPVHDVGEADGVPYFTMKLLPGGTLADTLKKGALPVRDAARMMATLARAVHHAHERGVLHRDLKPANVLFDAAGQPLLADFGLAKLAGSDCDMTLSSARLGTPQYMSPEQATGRVRDVTAVSDVWSLGAMFHQMLTGRVPFPGPTHHEVFRRIADERPDPTGWAALPPDLVTLTLRCLEKDPAARPPSAAFLAEELERWLRGETILSRPVPAAERLRRWCRRHPWRVAAGVALVASVTAGTVSSLVLWRRAESHATEALRERDRAADEAARATVAHALAERGRFDFGRGRELLASLPAERRSLEWRLVHGLCRGDDVWATSLPLAQPVALALDPAAGTTHVLTRDRTVHTLSTATGETTPAWRVPELPSPPGAIRRRGLRDFGFAPDGAHWHVCDGATVIIGRRAEPSAVQSFTVPAATAAWLDARRLLAASSSDFRVEHPSGWVRDVITGTTTPLEQHDGMAGPVAVSPDGRFIAWARALDGGHVVEIRRTADYAAEAPLLTVGDSRAGYVAVSAITFSADGARLAVGWKNENMGHVTLHEVADGRLVTQQPVAGSVSLAFTTGGRLAIASGDPWVTVVNPEVPVPDHSVYDDANLGMGDFIDPGQPLRPPIRLLTRSAQSGRATMLFGHEAAAAAVFPLAGHEGVLSVGLDGTVRRWPTESDVWRQRLNNLRTSHRWHHPAASPDGRWVIGLHVRGYPIVRDMRSGEETQFPESERGIACFDDGRVLTRDGEAHLIRCRQITSTGLRELWSAPCERSIQGFRQIIHSAVTPDGSRVAVLMPGKVLVVDMETHAVRETGDQVMNYGSTPGQSIDISPDGRWIAVTGFALQRTRLYDAADPSAGYRPTRPAVPLETFDTACVFSRDGKQLYTGNEDGRIRVYDVETAAETMGSSWAAHTTPVTALAISRAGDRLATAADGALALWQTQPTAPERRERLRIPQDRARNWMHFATGDSALLHAAPDRPVEVWHAPAE